MGLECDGEKRRSSTVGGERESTKFCRSARGALFGSVGPRWLWRPRSLFFFPFSFPSWTLQAFPLAWARQSSPVGLQQALSEPPQGRTTLIIPLSLSLNTFFSSSAAQSRSRARGGERLLGIVMVVLQGLFILSCHPFLFFPPVCVECVKAAGQ